MTEEVTTVYKFKTELNKQPQFFEMNTEQKICLTASNDDGIYTDIDKDIELDMDETYSVQMIKEIIYDADEDMFYFLSNKYEEKLGFFVIRINENNPKSGNFLIKWKNKLDIGDTNIYVLRNFDRGTKEVIISFKTIYINTYNIVVMDISEDN